MKWSTIKTIALVALAAVVLWQLGSFELLAGLGLGGWLERERNRRSGGAPNASPPDRPPAEKASTSSSVDEAAKEHAEKVEPAPPEADSPESLFEQQAEEL